MFFEKGVYAALYYRTEMIKIKNTHEDLIIIFMVAFFFYFSYSYASFFIWVSAARTFRLLSFYMKSSIKGQIWDLSFGPSTLDFLLGLILSESLDPVVRNRLRENICFIFVPTRYFSVRSITSNSYLPTFQFSSCSLLYITRLGLFLSLPKSKFFRSF